MFIQYKLPYQYDALEPYIDALTMEIHYSKHHATYTKNLNDAASKAGVLDQEITDIFHNLDNIQDESLRKAIRNNGGGYYNHNLYFTTISPNGGGEPSGELKKAIDNAFGSYGNFREELSALALGQFGSGWAWLSANNHGELQLSSSPNQDNPIIEGTEYVPILEIDVWEHAYYLKYKNLRANYINEFYNVIDWDAVEKNYDAIRTKIKIVL